MPRVYEIGAEERTRIARLVAGELAQDPCVAFAYVYGSFAEARPFHDIDIGVYRIGSDSSADPEQNLAQRLSAALKMPVDVRVVNHAPTSFLFHVLRGELLFSRDDELLSSVIENTIRRYLDIAPMLRHSAREAFAE
jgi:uncharacterized protein